MKKQNLTKIIGMVIMFIFVFSFVQIILPTNINAASQIDWENPNKSGKTYNKYKFKITDVVNSDVAMQVIGCTGVVNKVSTWMQKLATDKLKDIAYDKLLKQAKKACRSGEKVAVNSAGAIINVNDLTSGVDMLFDCGEIMQTEDGKTLRYFTEEKKATEKRDNMEQCFSGIATTLAKNQLTAMTRSAVSWVNTGFSGNPLYVQNITSLTNSIERNVLEEGMNKFKNPNNAYPYGSAFSRSVISGYRSGGIFGSGNNALDNLTSDLSAFISDPVSYSSGSDERTALQRSKDANIAFSNDFSTGGWDGWLAFTQRDSNNPLGFTMQAAQNLADDIAQQKNNTENELIQNDGFLSQKKCTLWQVHDSTTGVIAMKWDPVEHKIKNFTSKTKTNSFDECKEWETITPGSIIKEQMSAYITSPVRQLELADTINESLNAVFSILMSKLQSNGLTGLSSEEYAYTDENMNWTDNSSNGGLGGANLYDNNGAYSSGFDLTRDLGNTYIYDEPTKIGTWNADSEVNLTDKNQSLYSDLAPVAYDEITKPKTSNIYYTVSNSGKTKLVTNGYNGWAIGDRAFWNGSSWQNWKKDQTNPIKKRGVIQIQKDYIVAAKESLQFLPNVMPKLGELDYCIPGPNPSYKINVGQNQSLYTDWVGTLSGVYDQNGIFERDSTQYHIAQPGDKEYDDWKNIFDDNPSVWSWLAKDAGTEKHAPHFYYSHPLMLGNGKDKNDESEAKHTNWMDNYMYMVNNYMFTNFYEVFDKMMNKTYFANITTEYLQNEKYPVNIDLDKNPSYIPMAEEGLALTKDIVSYDEDINSVMDQYRSDIAQANANIGKLETIKRQVSNIIKAAQDRRDANLIEQVNKINSLAIENCKAAQVECDNSTENVSLCLEEYNICIENSVKSGGILTNEQYKAKYKECLDEEDILYYDDSDIMNDQTGERCNNNLDDDMDGLIDIKDPDCRDSVIEAHCETNSLNYETSRIVHGFTPVSCKAQDSALKNTGATEQVRESSCLSYSYYTANNGKDESTDPYIIYNCNWIPKKIIN
ncbi:MAG: hypothetical protein WCT42_00395 [Candidatus Paceibacterota bacterium]